MLLQNADLTPLSTGRPNLVGKEGMYDEIDLLLPNLTVEALKQLIRINTAQFAP